MGLTPWLAALAQLLKLANLFTEWFFSSEQVNVRDERRVDRDFQNFDKALKNNNAAYVTGAAADLHNRVSQTLRRGRRE